MERWNGKQHSLPQEGVEKLRQDCYFLEMRTLKLLLALLGLASLTSTYAQCPLGQERRTQVETGSDDDDVDIEPLEEPASDEGTPLNEALANPNKAKYCFTTDARHYPYSAENAPVVDLESLYNDWVTIFDWGFENEMGPPMQGFSGTNPLIPRNRIPGFCIRGVFHDSGTMPATSQPFPDIISEFVQGSHWNGPEKWLKASSADGSVAICRDERLHPNNNYDQFSSRMLRSWQENLLTDNDGHKVSMMKKWGMSHTDTLHNCAMAALQYLSKGEFFTAQGDFMNFGRLDACYIKHKKVFPLCGNSDILPAPTLDAVGFYEWWDERGFEPPLQIGALSSHTIMDDKPLEAITSWNTDYTVFLRNGTHIFNIEDTVEPEEEEPEEEEPVNERVYKLLGLFDVERNLAEPGTESLNGCKWDPDGDAGPLPLASNWPHTFQDCTIGNDAIKRIFDALGLTIPFEEHFLGEIQSVVTEFADNEALMTRYFLCAMQIFTGGKHQCYPFLDPKEAVERGPKSLITFGAYTARKINKAGCRKDAPISYVPRDPYCWENQGCFWIGKDQGLRSNLGTAFHFPGNPRITTEDMEEDVSIEACAKICEGADLFAVVYINHCKCAFYDGRDVPIPPKQEKSEDTKCDTCCLGHPRQICGGDNGFGRLYSAKKECG
ncbi:unnamed protein product, partial [Chrysoparadoxa australica]